MKRGRATAIIEEVRSAVLRWQDFATHAQVTDNWVPQIQNSFRLEIPNGS
jgi:hypothetical protein